VYCFGERTNPKRPIKGGQFVLPCHKLYIQPKPGTVFLFDSTHMYYGTIGSSGFKQMGIALFTEKIIYDKLLQYRETLGSHEVNMKHYNEIVESYNAEPHPKRTRQTR
jgi:hypothetical protein